MTNQSRVVHLPVHVSERLTRVSTGWEWPAQGLKRYPTSEEVAAEAGLAAGRRWEINKVSQQPVSLDRCYGEGSMAELIEDGGWAELSAQNSEEIVRKQVQHALCHLTARERRGVELRYGLDGVRGCTLDQIARGAPGVSPSAPSYLPDALTKLRHSTSSAPRHARTR